MFISEPTVRFSAVITAGERTGEMQELDVLRVKEGVL